MVADDDRHRTFVAAPRGEKRQQRADLAIRVAQRLPISIGQARGQRQRRLSRIVGQAEWKVGAVGRDEREERVRRRGRVMPADLADHARHDVVIRGRHALGDQIDHGRIPLRQPPILVVEAWVGADVYRLVAGIAQARRDAVETAVREIRDDFLPPVRPGGAVKRQHGRRAREAVGRERRKHHAARGQRVQVGAPGLARARDQREILGPQTLDHDDDDVRPVAAQGVAGVRRETDCVFATRRHHRRSRGVEPDRFRGTVHQRVVVAQPRHPRRQPQELAEVTDGFLL